MKLIAKRIFIVFLVSLISYIVFRRGVDMNVISIMYNVASIMFSIGMGIIVTFSVSGIRNRYYQKKIKRNIKKIRDSYISYFSIITTLYLLNYVLPQNDYTVFKIKFIDMKFDSNIFIQYFTLAFCLFSLSYFILNFLGVQKLKDEIGDETRP